MIKPCFARRWLRAAYIIGARHAGIGPDMRQMSSITRGQKADIYIYIYIYIYNYIIHTRRCMEQTGVRWREQCDKKPAQVWYWKWTPLKRYPPVHFQPLKMDPPVHFSPLKMDPPVCNGPPPVHFSPLKMDPRSIFTRWKWTPGPFFAVENGPPVHFHPLKMDPRSTFRRWKWTYLN